MPTIQTIHPTYRSTLISLGSRTLNIISGLKGKARTEKILATKNSNPILLDLSILGIPLYDSCFQRAQSNYNPSKGSTPSETPAGGIYVHCIELISKSLWHSVKRSALPMKLSCRRVCIRKYAQPNEVILYLPILQLRLVQ